MKLYELPRGKNIKIYIGDSIVIFDHIDGMYSYCWLEKNQEAIVHLVAWLELKKYKDGYKAII